MKLKLLVVAGIIALVSTVPAVNALGDDDHGSNGADKSTGLIGQVREGTHALRNVENAGPAGYQSEGSCVSGPEEGAMGVHFANGDLVNDPALDPAHPEILLYEQHRGRMQLVGVEFIVLADAWDANNSGPPVLTGQLFHFVGSPNRYRLPAFYELHVWAWEHNPEGEFADWNPRVSCAEYTGEGAGAGAGH